MAFITPKNTANIIFDLHHHGYDAYFVGGCVRDFLMGKKPHDWDICTQATPKQVKESLTEYYKILDTGVKHGTVTVVCSDNEAYEVTTYRVDGKYSDNRHPDNITLTEDIIKDLSRRDFTINAIAYLPRPLTYERKEDEFVDPFNGITDIERKRIKCVGNPDDRFNEDGLRILRALRFASTLGFTIEDTTAASIHRNYKLLGNISAERIQSEFRKLICGENVYKILHDFSDVIAFIIPELEECIGCKQNNPWHIFDVYNHTIQAVSHSDSDDPIVNMALLLHDIGKPQVKTTGNDRVDHFYGHASVSCEKARIILERLRFPSDEIEKILLLIKYHDVYYEEDIKRSRIRKILNRLGSEDMFIKHIMVRRADIKAQSHLHRFDRLSKIDKIIKIKDDIIQNQDCTSIRELAINGNDLKKELEIPEGKMIGVIMTNIFNKVLDGTLENNHDALIQEARKIRMMM